MPELYAYGSTNPGDRVAAAGPGDLPGLHVRVTTARRPVRRRDERMPKHVATTTRAELELRRYPAVKTSEARYGDKLPHSLRRHTAGPTVRRRSSLVTSP